MESCLPTVIRTTHNMTLQYRLCVMLTKASSDGMKVLARILRCPWLWARKHWAEVAFLADFLTPTSGPVVVCPSWPWPPLTATPSPLLTPAKGRVALLPLNYITTSSYNIANYNFLLIPQRLLWQKSKNWALLSISWNCSSLNSPRSSVDTLVY